MISKQEYLQALELIEKFQMQEYDKIIKSSFDVDNRSIFILGLKTRELNCLCGNGIRTIGQLLATERSEIRNYRNLGYKGIVDINKKLKDFGIDTEKFDT